jgi:hypothetical protein
MSLPQVLKAPTAVRFDANNAEHREFFHNFRVNRSWKGAPRFKLEDSFPGIPEMITSRMLDYYMGGEFKL